MQHLEFLSDETLSTYGQPTNQTLVIGFTNVYYTLWVISTFAKVENVFYLQNLSLDFEAAQKKVSEIIAADAYYNRQFEVDLSLKGDSGRNFFRPLAAKRYAPELLAISRFAGTEMCSINPDEEYFSHEEKTKHGWQYAVTPVFKKMSGLLWATYLNKDETTFQGLRRRVIARKCLVKAGILFFRSGKYFTAEQLKRQADAEIKASAIVGHHETEGARIELNVKRLGKGGSFETQYGTTYIVTLIDDKNRLFKYMGTSNLNDIGENDYVKIKGTVKFDNYKDQPETKLQRIKVVASK